MIRDLLRRYKRHLVTNVVLYSAITIGLFFFTDSPQSVPFEYEIH